MTSTHEQIRAVAEVMLPTMKEVMEESFRLAGRIEALMRKVSVTPEEASLLTGIKASTLAKWRSQGIGPAYTKQGGVVVYPVKGLAAWNESRKVRTLDQN